MGAGIPRYPVATGTTSSFAQSAKVEGGGGGSSVSSKERNEISDTGPEQSPQGYPGEVLATSPAVSPPPYPPTKGVDPRVDADIWGTCTSKDVTTQWRIRGVTPKARL